MHKSFFIFLLATVALTLMMPAVSGISLLQQQAKAEKSGQNGKDGIINDCLATSHCNVKGGSGGSRFVGNSGDASSGNGGDGGKTTACGDRSLGGADCSAMEEWEEMTILLIRIL